MPPASTHRGPLLRFLEPLRESRRLRVLVFTAVVLVLAAFLLFRGLRQGMALSHGPPNDFAAYHGAARAVLLGDLVPSYSAPRPYQYPPALAVLLAPLGLLPERVAAALWTVGSLALLLWAFRSLERALGPPVEGVDKLLGLVLAFRALESDFSNGNANTLVLAVLIQGFSLIRGGRELLGGGALGLAAALKVTPAVLLAWILARRRWRQAGGFVMGLAVFGVLLPALVLGPRAQADAWRAFQGSLVAPLLPASAGAPDREAPGGYVPGQSLRALLHRLLRASDATAHDERVVRINLADLPAPVVEGLYLSLAAAILASLLVAFRGRGTGWSAAEIGAALASMALLSPLSRKAHFVALLPAAAAGFAIQRTAGCGRRWPGVLWWGAFTLAALTSPTFLGRRGATLVLAFCPLALAAALLIALCLTARRKGAPVA